MAKNDFTIKYFLYVRKSSESEDRQVASIDSQISELTKVAKRDNIKITNIFSESQSAKAPGRHQFNDMIQRISQGEAQGILCWKLDRLARNPIDGGEIMWLLQENTIKNIKTYDRDYYPTDNILMMSVEFGMANQFIRDLSQNTKRGLRAKSERGWYPTCSTLGYTYNPIKGKGEKEIIKDHDRFDLVRKIFNLMLTGCYTPSKILEIATNEWGLRNKKEGKISRSTIYRILTDPFYYGQFEYPKGSGNWYKGKHEPMITVEEFDKIQNLLGRIGKPRPRTHDFPFTGMIRCGECGAMITAEEKIKNQKNGNTHRYVYYHCTKRKNPDCSQKFIEQKELDKQIIEILSRIKIPTEFHLWAMKWIQIENQKEGKTRNQIVANHQTNYQKCLKKIDNLISMRSAGYITEEEFLRNKSELNQEKIKIEELLADTGDRVNKQLERAEEAFSFAEKAKDMFENGSILEKKEILATLGSDFILKDQKLSIHLTKPFILISGMSLEVNKINDTVRTSKEIVNKRTLEDLYSQSPMLLAWQDAFRTFDWAKAFPVPNLALKEIRQLLAIVYK